MNEQIKEQLENLFYSVSTENGRRLPQSLCEQLAEEIMKITGALSRSGGVWVKASERLPEKPGCYFVRWLEDGRVIIKGANMWELLPGEKFFDVSDDDDEDRTNPRSIQPHEWLDESPAADKGDAIDGWIDIKKELPKNNDNVLVYYGGNNEGIEVAFYNEKDKEWRGLSVIYLQKITHWRPLPQPPQSK